MLLAVFAALGCRAERLRPEPKVEREPLGAPAASARTTALPPPAVSGTMSVEQALSVRRSRREFAPTALSAGELGQLAWAAQGITDSSGGLPDRSLRRGSLPARALLRDGAGVLHYVPANHSFEQRSDRDLRQELSQAALDQAAVRLCPCDVVITSCDGPHAQEVRGASHAIRGPGGGPCRREPALAGHRARFGRRTRRGHRRWVLSAAVRDPRGIRAG